MPIEMSSFCGGVCNSMYNVTGFNIIFKSVFQTALVLSIIIMIILMFLYPCKANTPTYILTKIFLYIFAAVWVMFSIHDSIIKNNYDTKYSNKNATNLIDKINNSGSNLIYGGEKMHVKPDFTHKKYKYDDEDHVDKDDYDHHNHVDKDDDDDDVPESAEVMTDKLLNDLKGL